VAETTVRLVDKDGALEPFTTFHMEGHWDEDGTKMIAAIRQASGWPDLPVRRFPWGLLTIASPFMPLFRELKEMRHPWQISRPADECASGRHAGRRAANAIGSGRSGNARGHGLP
jgi:hypothetical protein